MTTDDNLQAAYEALSADGLVRPSSCQEPIMYGVKLIQAALPHFVVGQLPHSLFNWHTT